MSSQEKIIQWVSDILEEKDDSLFLVDVTVNPAPKGAKVIVHLDGDQGISIDTCAEVSRALSARLEEEDVMNAKYVLEVSSPGLDQPLKLHRQYVKNVGRNVKVLLQDNQTTKGTLLSVSDDAIELEPAKRQPRTGSGGKKKKKESITNIQIPFENIKKTNVLATL